MGVALLWLPLVLEPAPLQPPFCDQTDRKQILQFHGKPPQYGIALCAKPATNTWCLESRSDVGHREKSP